MQTQKRSKIINFCLRIRWVKARNQQQKSAIFPCNRNRKFLPVKLAREEEQKNTNIIPTIDIDFCASITG